MELVSWFVLVGQEPESALLALKQGIDPALANEEGLTALHLAILWGHEELSLALIEAGDPKTSLKAKTKAWVNNLSDSGHIHRPDGGWFSRPDTTDLLPLGVALDKGSTPLHAAASMGHVGVIQALLARKARATKDGVGATPLHLAALGGHVEAARALLNAKSAGASGTKVRKSLRFYDVGVTPLMAALESGSWALAQEILALGVDPMERTKFGCSALFFAARGGSLQAIDALVELGVDPKQTGDYSNFPMVEAVVGGHRDVVARLLELGANTVQPSGMHAPLLKAFERGDRAMVQVLMDGGAGPLPDHGPVFFAGVNDWVSLGKYLLAGGDPNVLRRGETPLMAAASDGHVEVTELLLAHGADPNCPGARGLALDWALISRHDAVVELLLAAGTDCSYQDSHGNQVLWPCMRIYGETRLPWLERMLDLGANPHRLSRHGGTSMAASIDMGMTQVQALFASIPVPGDADAAAYKEVGESAVLLAVDGEYSWKKLHSALWDELVPPSGPAPSMQGEMIRSIGRLTDEAYRNGNINWGEMQVEMLGFLKQHLLAEGGSRELEDALRKVGQHTRIDTSGDGSPHYRVSQAVVAWCVARPKLIPRA